MQIHELDLYTGTPSASDYLAVDDGVETTKIPMTSVGVPMTVEEAVSGTETDTRVVAPTVFHNAVESITESLKTLVITRATLSTLPITISDSNITSDMVVVNAVIGTPSAQTGDWTVTTSDGSLTVDGNIGSSTSLTLYLAKSR